jgi:hypothetical protein
MEPLLSPRLLAVSSPQHAWQASQFQESPVLVRLNLRCAAVPTRQRGDVQHRCAEHASRTSGLFAPLVVLLGWLACTPALIAHAPPALLWRLS